MHFNSVTAEPSLNFYTIYYDSNTLLLSLPTQFCLLLSLLHYTLHHYNLTTLLHSNQLPTTASFGTTHITLTAILFFCPTLLRLSPKLLLHLTTPLHCHTHRRIHKPERQHTRGRHVRCSRTGRSNCRALHVHAGQTCDPRECAEATVFIPLVPPCKSVCLLQEAHEH